MIKSFDMIREDMRETVKDVIPASPETVYRWMAELKAWREYQDLPVENIDLREEEPSSAINDVNPLTGQEDDSPEAHGVDPDYEAARADIRS